MTEDEIKKKTDAEKLANVKEEFAKVKLEEVKRQIEIWDLYIGFVTSKIAGCVAIVIGGLEIFYPDVLPAVIEGPGWLIGAGLTLLSGGRVLEVVIPFLQTVDGKK